MPNGERIRETPRSSGDNSEHKSLSLQKIMEGPGQAQDRGEGTSEGIRPHTRKNVTSLGPASDTTLTEQYESMSPSAHFRFLDKIVNQDEKITLVASPDIPGQVSDYDTHNHRISIPLNTEDGIARPLEDTREDILYELQNASMRGAFQYIDGRIVFHEPDQNSSRKEKEIYLCMRALYALANEWQEWMNTSEHDIRCQYINNDMNMGGRGPYVTRTYKEKYAQHGAEWYNFHKYLEDQIETGHIARWDPEAADSSWVGKHLLAVVEKLYSDRLIISPERVQNWQAGNTRNIQSPFSNPFSSSKVIDMIRALKD